MEILEFCVSQLQSKKVDKFELAWERSTSLGVEINEGKLDHLSRATDQGLSIRTLKNQRMGFSYTMDLSHDAVKKAVQTALEVGELMPADPLNDLCVAGGGAGFSKEQYPKIENYDAAGLEVSLEEKIGIARALEENAKKLDSKIKRVRKAAFDEAQGESVLVDHTGARISHRQTVFSVDLTCVAEEGSNAEMGYDSTCSCSYKDLKWRDVPVEAVHGAVELLGGGQAPTMTCPAIFKNSITAQLLGFLSSSFSAENIDKNFSLLVGKKGERLFSEKLMVIDDGLLPGGIATGPFDGEGNPSRTTRLVDQGVIANYLYDSYYARKHGTVTTGNSRRGGVKSPPGVGSTNLYLAAGTTSLDRLIGRVDRGVYITEVMGLHTANPVTGDFSFGASGLLIENGKLTRPVKGFAIAGNLIELLKNVAEVGSDLRFWGSVGAPSLLISKLSVSGS